MSDWTELFTILYIYVPLKVYVRRWYFGTYADYFLFWITGTTYCEIEMEQSWPIRSNSSKGREDESE
jgi:hypothetical protein